MNVKIDGKKYSQEQILEILIDHNKDLTWFAEEIAKIDAVQDRRNAIANGIAQRDTELRGKSSDFYILKRAEIEKEVAEAYDKEVAA